MTSHKRSAEVQPEEERAQKQAKTEVIVIEAVPEGPMERVEMKAAMRAGGKQGEGKKAKAPLPEVEDIQVFDADQVEEIEAFYKEYGVAVFKVLDEEGCGKMIREQWREVVKTQPMKRKVDEGIIKDGGRLGLTEAADGEEAEQWGEEGA
eukprot:CAMPEP_0173470734 /NCGR_PEP_ID=MMETSP1357-20121228/78034_1 /TAXON_ID=77926 /ORGANISM="Hemiselmis rufescens, Strain PCC563" /LENGTH=149 /DNA_ID=CAMNT_0014439021 /DNA_START=103 /DNA_END=551 /DNA_ORIENTATION=+